MLFVIACTARPGDLDTITAQLPQLRTRIEALGAQGVDVAYPLVDLTVLELFVRFVPDDLTSGKLSRARRELDEMATLLEVCDAELTRLEAGSHNPGVPRYKTSAREIEDGSFSAAVRFADGTQQEAWPVILHGFTGWDRLRDDLELMPDLGLHIVQFELGPRYILPEENEIDLTLVNDLLAVLDRAAVADIAVDVQLSPHYFPEWAYDKWSELDILPGEYLPFSVDSEQVRAVLKTYIEAIIPILSGHPALNSICLSNEPSYFTATLDPLNRDAYTAWLLAEYGSLEAVAAVHGVTYYGFGDVPVFYSDWPDFSIQPDDGADQAAGYDYYRFNDQRFAAFHQWLADTIHAIDPEIPVHAKFSDYTMNVAMEGVDPDQFMAFSQIAGNDAVNYYRAPDTDFGYANAWFTENRFFDLLSSISGLPIFNSENHVIADTETQPTPVVHISNVLWQAAIHGQCASTMWVWERDIVDEATGELLDEFTSIMHRPEVLAVHSRTALDLLRLGREVQAFQRTPARVALLYSATSLYYNYFHDVWLDYVYIALDFGGEEIGFITESMLAAGKADAYEMLVLPAVSHLSNELVAVLETYAAGGGLLVFAGDEVLAYDQRGQPRGATVDEALLLEGQTPEALRPGLITLLESLSNGRPLVLIDIATGAEPWGISWREVEHEGRVLLSLSHHGLESVTLRLDGYPSEARTDLISLQTVGSEITLAPLEVMLVAADKP
ncbi:MAG: hypothetical protein GY868_20435 [Deltaproteobacteria bacterium]|nr:hypothetical protein [Deltaproteobacteria bacterium]